MKIEITSIPDQYKNFVEENTSTFYQSIKHLKFLECILKENVQAVTVKKNNELKGIMPFISKKTKFGQVINSLPFFGSYGGIIAQDTKIKKEIINFFNEFNKKNDILASVIIENPFEIETYYKKYFNFSACEKRRIQCLNMNSSSQEQLWSKFEQRVRRAIRKAEKNHVTIEYFNKNQKILNHFYELHISNIASKNGTIKPKEFFSIMKENFLLGIDYDILIAKQNKDRIAYLLIFYFKDFVEYYMPAYIPEKSNLQGTSLLIWESMKKALSKNIKFYNFGGTHFNQKSLYNFKKGWGASDMNYSYYIYANLDELKEINRNELQKECKNFYVYNYDKL